MRNIYFYFVDYKYPPFVKDRDVIGFDNWKLKNGGFTDVSFGKSERYLLIYTFEKTARKANARLLRLIDKYDFTTIPISLDRIKANILINTLNIISKGCNAIMQFTCDIKDVDIKTVKKKINNNILQIEKWKRKYTKIMDLILGYERKPNDELKALILNDCMNLNIILEGK